MSKFHKKIVEGGAFGILDVYLSFLFSFVYVFIIARILTPQVWGQLILSISFINFAQYLCSFYPPSVEVTLQFYVPKLMHQDNQKVALRKFLFQAYKSRLLTAIVVFIGFIIIISISNLDPSILVIVYTLSPLIILGPINSVSAALLIGYQKFKSSFIVSLINSITISTCLVLIFLFHVEQPIFLVSLSHLISTIVPFFAFIFIILPLLPQKTNTPNIENTESIFKLQTNYGLNLLIAGLIVQAATLFMNFMFLTFGMIVYITYLSICSSIVNMILKFSGSDRSRYLSVFSELFDRDDPKQYERIFYQMHKLISIMLALIAAIFFFFADVYVLLMYSQIYLGILIPILIFLFTALSRVITRNLILIANSTNHTVINLKLNLFENSLKILFTFITLFFFDFLFLIVFYVLISYISIFFVLFLLNRASEFSIKLKPIFFPFIIFMVSIIASVSSTFFINFNLFPISLLNLLLTDGVRFVIFMIFFYLLVYFTKVINRNEIDQLVKLIPILKSNNRFIQRLIGYFKLLFPKNREY